MTGNEVLKLAYDLMSEEESSNTEFTGYAPGILTVLLAETFPLNNGLRESRGLTPMEEMGMVMSCMAWSLLGWESTSETDSPRRRRTGTGPAPSRPREMRTPWRGRGVSYSRMMPARGGRWSPGLLQMLAVSPATSRRAAAWRASGECHTTRVGAR